MYNATRDENSTLENNKDPNFMQFLSIQHFYTDIETKLERIILNLEMPKISLISL